MVLSIFIQDDKKVKTKPAAPPKKTKVDLSNPLEKEKADTLAGIEKSKEALEKYNDKLNKLREAKDKMQSIE